MNWLTVDDVAKALDLKKSSVYTLVAQGKIRHCKIGPGKGKTRFTQAHVDEYIESVTRGGETEKRPEPGVPRRRVITLPGRYDHGLGS